jgi:flagellar biosynthesis chaperone FliJ
MEDRHASVLQALEKLDRSIVETSGLLDQKYSNVSSKLDQKFTTTLDMLESNQGTIDQKQNDAMVGLEQKMNQIAIATDGKFTERIAVQQSQLDEWRNSLDESQRHLAQNIGSLNDALTRETTATGSRMDRLEASTVEIIAKLGKSAC